MNRNALLRGFQKRK